MAFASLRFLIQFMWSKRFYSDFLMVQRSAEIHLIDFIIKIVDACAADLGEIGVLYRRFCADHDLEVFATPGELFTYWSQPAQFDRLKSGDYGKLNFQYTFIILLEHRAAFDGIVYSVCETLAMVRDESTRETYLVECEEVLRFNRARAVQFASDCSPIGKSQEKFSRDILAWRWGSDAGGCKYEFYLSTK